MLDQLSTMRLMVALIGAVYLMLAHMGRSGSTRAIMPLVIASSAVVGIWVFAPDFLAVGRFDLPGTARQAGLIVGGVGVIARYLAFRKSVSDRVSAVATVIATPIVAAGLALATANWLVATGLGVVAATALLRRVAASPGGDSQQSQPRQDDE